MDKPNGRLVLVSYTHCCASTSSLSTRWSSWALHFPFGLGDLILERASRLYAFSGYHNRTSLPSRAFGKTTATKKFGHPGPLVLRTTLFQSPTPNANTDRTGPGHSEP